MKNSWMKKPDYRILKLTLRRLQYYFIVFGVFIFLLILATIWLFGKISESKAEIAKLKELSLVNLEEVNHESVLQLTTDATKLANFLPDEFDMYQVIALTDQIAKKTRFTIQSYSLQSVEVSEGKIQSQALNLVGTGTIEQLMAFVEEYKFITGKIVTIDSLNLTGDKRILSNLAVNIYAYKPVISLENEPIRVLDETDKYILSQVRKYYMAKQSIILDTDYENKENPFN